MDTDFNLENSIICPTREESGMGMALSLTYSLKFSDGNDSVKFEVNDFTGPGYGLIIDEFNGRHLHHDLDELDEVGFTNIKVCGKASLSRQILSILRGLFENEVNMSWKDVEDEIRNLTDEVRFNLNSKIEEENES